jgi:hypothetical protein
MKKLAFLLLAAIPALLNAQTDDFDDGDDRGWTHYDPIEQHPLFPGIATWTVVNGGYRIQTAPSPAPGNPPNGIGPGRAGAFRSESNYTDFYITVDIVNWDTNLNQAFGILARVTQIGLGTSDGYAMTWDAGGRDLDISRFTDEAPRGADNQSSGTDRADIVPGRSYRMVFAGKGSKLRAEIYELPNVDTPMAYVTADDATWTGGLAGLIVYDNSTAQNGRTDATFDNYFALPFQPPRLKIQVMPFEIRISWPADPPNYALQFCRQLGVDWTDVTDPIGEQDGRRYYDDSWGEERRFYRLKPLPTP